MLHVPGPAAAEWDGLAEKANNIFSTRAWTELWWRHFGAGTPVVLTDSDTRPSVILPMYLSPGPLRRWRVIGHGLADELGAVCAPEDRGLASALVREHLAHSPDRWDMLVLHDVAHPQDWAELSCTQLSQVVSPVMRFDSRTWPEFLAEKSRNFRSQLSRRLRQLESRYTVTFRETTADTFLADRDALFRLHAARWGARAPFVTGRRRQFHESFAAEALARGWLRLRILELDGVAAAALYGFRFAGAEYQYQGGRDPRFEKDSIGLLLYAHAAQAALEDGVAEKRLLRGGEAYKERFANLNTTVHTLAASRTLRGAVVLRTEQSVRRRVLQLRQASADDRRTTPVNGLTDLTSPSLSSRRSEVSR